MITCWSPKGGSGTTVVATVLALELSRLAGKAVLVDAHGDCATVLGVSIEPERPGLRQWLASSETVPLEASERLLVEVTPQLQLLPPGRAIPELDVVEEQAVRLARSNMATNAVADAGRVDDTSFTAAAMVEVASMSLMVVRSCYLTIKRATAMEMRCDGFVLIEEAGRSLDARDIEDVIGVPSVAAIAWDPTVARLVDAGRMKSRLPKSLRPLQRLAKTLQVDHEG